jgi:polyhydroxybutyrate depolymerase
VSGYKHAVCRIVLSAALASLFLAACNRPLGKAAEPPNAAATASAAPGPTTVAPLMPTLVLPTQPGLPGQAKEIQFESGGAARAYWIYIPSRYSAATPAPLVINFHGLGANGFIEAALSGMSPKAEAEGFIVVYPNGVDSAWLDIPGSPDLRFTRDLIAQLQSTLTIDPKRVYVTGISNGGGMTNRVGCALADVVAAIAPVEGAYNLWSFCQPSRAMPMVAFHGLADKLVPYEGVGQGNIAPPIREWAAAWASRDGCAATPAVTLHTQDVTGETWGGCRQGAEVVLYTIAGHGHSWPGSVFLPQITSKAINATDVMWDFFKAHPMP